MPIYEYKCQECDRCFEKLVFKGDQEDVACPECGEKKVNRLMSCASVFGTKGIGTCAAPAPGGYS
jgi:putative FmdB family regulatory protein